MNRMISILLLVPALGSLVTLGLFRSFLSDTQDDLHFVNVVGYQRSLARDMQRHVVDMFNDSESSNVGLTRDMERFGATMDAMNGRGSDDPMLTNVPEDLDHDLININEVWDRVKVDLALLRDGARPEGLRDRIDADLVLLHAATDTLVFDFESRERTRHGGMYSTISGLLIFNIAIFIMGLVITARLGRPDTSEAEEGSARLALARNATTAWEWDPITDRLTWHGDWKAVCPDVKRPDTCMDLERAIVESDRDRVQALLTQSMDEDESIVFECRLETGSGTHWIGGRACGSRRGDGTAVVTGLMWSGADQKSAEDALANQLFERNQNLANARDRLSKARAGRADAEAARDLANEGRIDAEAARDLANEGRIDAEAARDVQTYYMTALTNSLDEGICLLSRDRQILVTNPAADRLFPLLGVDTKEPVHTIAGEPIERFLTRTRRQLMLGQGKEKRSFEIAGRVLSADQGNGAVLVIREVTAEKLREAQTQQQYRLASVGQLASGIAHDFNNLLTVMMGSAQVLDLRSDLPLECREELARIMEQGHRASQLIRQILDLGRENATEKSVIDLGPFVKESVRLVGRLLPASIDVIPDVQPGAYPVLANLTQFHQISNNISINASQAMPEGGSLKIGLRTVTVPREGEGPLPLMAAGDWVEWSFSDTGEGIPPEVLSKIFEPFFTTKDPEEGTGLGLAQSQAIVSNHDGFIDVDSAVGEGTTFRIYLPLEQRAVEEERQRHRLAVEAARRRSVLLAEDEDDVRHMTRSLLEHLDCTVVEARDGEEALELFEANPDQFDTVMSDIVMPGMSGLKLCAAIKEKYPETPVVLMSGYAIVASDDDQSTEKADAWINKPLTLDNLSQALEQTADGVAAPDMEGAVL